MKLRTLLSSMLLAERRAPLAIEVLEEVTRRFPTSANAWDSLAEACEGASRLDEARTASAQGLAVLAQMPAGPRRDAIEKALRDRAARLAR